MASNKARIFSWYKTLQQKYYNTVFVEDVYKSPSRGIVEYAESCQEFYNNRLEKYGYKKLHQDEDAIRRSVAVFDHLMEILERFRKEKFTYEIFFVEDKKNNDLIPVLTLFGSKSGLIGAFFNYRNNNGDMYNAPLIYFRSTQKIFTKIYRHIDINW